MKDEIDSLVTN